jgi:hypothetical protein
MDMQKQINREVASQEETDSRHHLLINSFCVPASFN